MSEVTSETRDGVAIITLNAPERRNAISPTMLTEISGALLLAENNRDVRCVILTGAGSVFCAGLDMASAAKGEGMLAGLSSGDGPPPGEVSLRDIPPIVLHKMDTPTICAMNGGAAGYGMDLAYCCDMRVAVPRAKLAMVFTARGILPESGGTWLLPRLVGWAKASELLFTAATIRAEEAQDLGLVNRIADDSDVMPTALALAYEIAANAPLAVRATKRMMRHAMTEGFEDHIQRQFTGMLPLLGTADFREAAMAFMEKRDANFEGR
jgi:enoyl-CoA hydratase/carnithine racemase